MRKCISISRIAVHALLLRIIKMNCNLISRRIVKNSARDLTVDGVHAQCQCYDIVDEWTCAGLPSRISDLLPIAIDECRSFIVAFIFWRLWLFASHQ